MSELHKNLKSLRRERKIELQAIEKRTKIDLKYLKAIESGNFEVLPSTYIRLFLKAYCVEIGADPLDALHQLDELINNEKKPNKGPLPKKDTNEDIAESIDRVIGKDGRKYSIKDAYEKKIDWIQIDVGFLTEQEMQTVLAGCKYAVINGSHTIMGEVMGMNSKPIIGMPIYDEHTNQIKWAEEKQLGVLAENKKQVIKAIQRIKQNYNKYEEKLEEFSKKFDGNGAENAAKIVSEILETKK